ncbi:MAG TPA: ATP-binding cassette domain-containing protein [Clostridiales bacterium]|nr:ATP-binding cassette domain-containing protein [Clostridiales bacterium]
MEILHFENISFTYPNSDSKAVDNFSLSVKSGEFVVICGKSGCGKTTLLKLIKKELTPHGHLNGEILYKGMPITELEPNVSAREIGFVKQDPDSQLVTDKVWHELAFGLENLNVPPSAMRLRIGEISDYFGINEWFYRDVNTLSGGQKQLVNLAAAMIMQPELLLLDEPTSQLDPVAAADFISILEKLNKELGVTIIIAEHRLEELFPIADRIVLMDSGRILINSDPRGFGEKVKDLDEEYSRMLPSAIRIFNGVKVKAPCPLTVKEAREFVNANFKNDIKEYVPPEQKAAGNTALRLEDVWFRYERDSQDVLKGLKLTLEYGELFCVLGANGSGKTTMLNVAAGLDLPYKGQVFLEEKKINKKNFESFRTRIAYLPQNPQLMFVKDSIADDFFYMLNTLGLASDKAKELVETVAGKVGINDLLDKHPYDLSLGQLQKCALAKLLLQRPKILLLDEPTMGLDAIFKRVLADILINIKTEDAAVLMVTHDIEFAAENADRCALIFDGGIISSGTPEDFFSNNYFYTTAANRISRNIYKGAITCEQVIEMCLKNGVRDEKD